MDLIFQNVNKLITSGNNKFSMKKEFRKYFQNTENNPFCEFYLEKIWDQLILLNHDKHDKATFQLLFISQRKDDKTVFIVFLLENVGSGREATDDSSNHSASASAISNCPFKAGSISRIHPI